MTAQKEWTPRHDGDAPDDWAKGSKVQFRYGSAWQDCHNPAWEEGNRYRYTPKPTMPSDAALLVAHKRVWPDTMQADNEQMYVAREVSIVIELARMIERYEPHLLRDPLEDVVADMQKDRRWLDDSTDIDLFASELRKRGVKLEGEG